MSKIEEIVKQTAVSISATPTACSVQSSPVQSSPVQSSPILNFEMTYNDKDITGTGTGAVIAIAMIMITANAIETHPEFLIVAEFFKGLHSIISLEVLELLKDVLLLLFHLRRNLTVLAVQLPVDVHGVVDHVRGPKERQSSLCHVLRRIWNCLGGDERIDVFQQGEHHVKVQIRTDGVCQIVYCCR